MSGVIKGIKKVFKKVVNVVKKIIKPLAIAVAVYFTAGLALSAFAPTAGFAASMPGFASGGLFGTGFAVGSAPVVAGGGVFSSVATAIGLGGGLAAGAAGVNASAAAAAMASGAMGVVEAASIYGPVAVEAGMAANITAGMGAGAASAASAAISPAASTALASSGMMGPGAISNTVAASAVGMSLTDKILISDIGIRTAGAIWGPDAQELAELEAVEAAKFRGAYYGMTREGETVEPTPAQQNQPTTVPPQPAVANQSITPQQEQLLTGRATREELFPTTSQPIVAQATGPGQMKSNIAIPNSLFGASTMEGVRYI